MQASPTPPSPPYTALTVAKWFISWANSNDADLSNLKLQKLIYYAQGYWLAFKTQPLFGDSIHAWSHGPVVPNVYHCFKKFGSGDIRLPPDDDFDWDHVDAETTQHLIEIWDKFGGFGAWRLRNMTHAEAPWKEHFEDGVRDIEIPCHAMERFFKLRLTTQQ
jgi:uncharacterized phage-associated protein